MFAPDYFGEGHYAADYFPPASTAVITAIPSPPGGGRLRHFVFDESIGKKKKKRKKVLDQIAAKKRTIAKIENSIVGTESLLRKVRSKPREILRFDPPTYARRQETLDIRKIIEALEAEEKIIFERKKKLQEKKIKEEELLIILLASLYQ